ncbi:LOW QUALITY PROTEIN: hypothetical protein Cgig2_033872 [Carnegiea gigantea]|uniref:Uncharacterized protein n=1 Tax=Carnegiea gigantea TaxID=171969 RepID=A0A9Q1Q8I0_9CARY|nr:LOW QUALITY PROTEIN: hypothetical protein Cgig2_033872 [Carnegiea gigantea]
MYLLALPPGQEAAKLNIKLATLNELNGVVIECDNCKPPGFHVMCTTSDMSGRTHLGMELQRACESFVLTKPVHYDINYGGICGNTRVGSRNARRLLDEAHHLNYYYRQPLGFVGGVTILWDNSKVEVCGFTSHDMDMSCIVKVRTLVNHLTLGLEVCPFNKMFTYVHHKLTTFIVQGLV